MDRLASSVGMATADALPPPIIMKQQEQGSDEEEEDDEQHMDMRLSSGEDEEDEDGTPVIQRDANAFEIASEMLTTIEATSENIKEEQLENDYYMKSTDDSNSCHVQDFKPFGRTQRPTNNNNNSCNKIIGKFYANENHKFEVGLIGTPGTMVKKRFRN